MYNNVQETFFLKWNLVIGINFLETEACAFRAHYLFNENLNTNNNLTAEPLFTKI